MQAINELENGTCRDLEEDDLFEECVGTCNSTFQDIAIAYRNNYHIGVSSLVCIFGIVSNTLNILVLTKKEMSQIPINRIITAHSVSDLLVMFEYLLFSYYYYVVILDKREFPYWGAVYTLFHLHFSQILHTASVCLTLTLALWRYLALGFPNKAEQLCSDTRCTLGIVLSFIIPPIICTPTYLMFTIACSPVEEDKIYILYHTQLSELGKRNDNYFVNFWIYNVIMKLVPCILLTIITCWLTRTMIKAKRHKQKLKSINKLYFEVLTKRSKGEQRVQRTTKLLIAVLLLFLITEFPQALYGLAIGLLGKCYLINCYQNIGEIFDLLALFNGAVNFVIYYMMNKMFRSSFASIARSLYKSSPNRVDRVGGSKMSSSTRL